LVADVRKDQAAAWGADQHHACQHGGKETAENRSATKHRPDGERQSSPPASKTCARSDTFALSLSTPQGYGLRESNRRLLAISRMNRTCSNLDRVKQRVANLGLVLKQARHRLDPDRL